MNQGHNLCLKLEDFIAFIIIIIITFTQSAS
jgi:hypothetical protein